MSMNSRQKRWMWWLAALAVMIVGVAVIAIPTFVIMPFKAQTATGVEWSYHLRRWAPLITVLATTVLVAICMKLWHSARWSRRVALVALCLPLLLVTWFARQNHFEWMFNPITTIAYAPSREADFIAAAEMVMGIVINGEAVAYPVRQMAYHHIVNDVIGGKPITATY